MKKVMLVSAYMPFLTRNTALLTGRGLEIYSTKSGAEALKLHAEHHVDLVLSDFKLEDMGGETLCSLIRKGSDAPQVPVIITCHNIPGSLDKLSQCGANSIIVKPIEPISLIGTIAGFLDFQLVRSKRVVLKVFVFSKAYDQEFLCFSHDLSNTGILIETDYDLELGSLITCHFNLPEICQIEAEGEVARYMPGSECKNLYGIKFISLPLSSRKNIDKYISSIRPPLSLVRGG